MTGTRVLLTGKATDITKRTSRDQITCANPVLQPGRPPSAVPRRSAGYLQLRQARRAITTVSAVAGPDYPHPTGCATPHPQAACCRKA